MSIRKKLILLLFLTSFISMTFVGFVAFGGMFKSVEKEIIQEQSIIVDKQVVEVKLTVERFRKIPLFLSQLPSVQGMLRSQSTQESLLDEGSFAKWKGGVEVTFRSLLESNEDIDQVSLVDKNGVELVRLDRDVGKPQVVSTQDRHNRVDTAYFQEAIQLERSKIYVSDLSLNKNLGKIEKPFRPTMYFAAPIFDDQGARQGVVVINTFMEPLLRTLRSEVVIGDFIMTDQDGFFIVHPQKKKNYSRDLDQQQNYFREQPELIENVRGYHWKSHYDLKEQEFRFWKKVFYDEEDRSKFWILLSRIDEKLLFAPIYELRLKTFFVGAIALCLIGILAFIIGRQFSRPILELHRGTEMLSGGDLHYRVKIDTADEVGHLAQAFNQMADSLLENQQALEKSTLSLGLSMKNIKNQNAALVRTKKVMVSMMQELKEERQKLERQQKVLEKVNLELDSFVYTASHDLRAPLRGISSFANFLEEDYSEKLDDEGKNYIQRIRKGAERLSSLIDDLLALSRISRIHNPYTQANINNLVRTILERIEFDIKEHNVDLKIQENMPVIICDEIKLGEVFLNLINNAIKFSSKNNHRPYIEVGYNDHAEVHEFYVRDNGIGIDPRFHDKVFQIFQRLHKEGEYEGTGAGLSIVKRIVDDHGGVVRIESKLGEGTCFYFTIPKDLQKDEQGVLDGRSSYGV